MNRANSAITGLVVCACFMVFLMCLSVKHHGASGQTLGVIEFILLWCREIILLTLLVVTIIVLLLLRLVGKGISENMIQIKPIAKTGRQIYEHLNPVVDYLLSRGNELEKGFRWGSDREGYFCMLKRPLDIGDLKNVFSFPPSILLVERNGMTEIYCKESGARILGGHP